MNDNQRAAKIYLQSGLKPLPTQSNKMPAVKGKGAVSDYRAKDIKPTDIPYLFKTCGAVSIMTGECSDNLEVIDIDTKNDVDGNLMELLWDAFYIHTGDLVDRLPLVQTKSGGYHLYYRCNEIGGNQKLASRPPTQEELKDNPDLGYPVLVETRGEGGYVVAPPSKGYTIQASDLSEVPKISVEQRNGLLKAARSIDKCTLATAKKMTTKYKRPASSDLRPGDDYNDRVDVEDSIRLLQEHGWTEQGRSRDGNKVFLLRPGKTDSLSSGHFDISERVLFVFSTSTVFKFHGSCGGFNPFSIFTTLKHNGDYSAAAKELSSLGYGTPSPSRDKSKPTKAKKQAGSTQDDEKELTKYDEALEFVKMRYSLEFNQITRFVENNGERLTDYDYNSIYINLKRNHYKIGKDDTYSLINSDCTPAYNPLERFIESQSKNITTGHLAKLGRTIETTTGLNAGRGDFAEFFVTRWYVGMIACAFGGYVNPLVLVFCGGKNVGKTEWFRRLLPDELKPYMAESKLDDGKDSEIMMTDKIMIMDDEYGGKSKRDAKKLKEISSKDYFTVRPAYGRTSIRLRRLASLCGTSNEYDVINDITGNRRVIPVKIISLNHKLYNEIDKVALFMEGYQLFKEWEEERKWELKTKDIEFLNKSTSDFEEVRIEREMFLKYFEKPDENNVKHVVFMQTTEIITFIQDRHKIALSIKRMGAEMRAMEIEKKAGKGKNRGQKGYLLVKRYDL